MTPKLTERLSKLIPRLATDADGEILATVRAIRAALQSEGLDLHDLASSIAKSKIPAVSRAPQISPALTWAAFTHQERLAWMKVILAADDLGPLERDRLRDLGEILRTGLYSKVHNRRVMLFDEQLARAHARGRRP
jgi:hypothetical protein